MLAPQRHGSNKTQSLLSANNHHLFGPYPPIPRQAFMSLEPELGDRLLEEIVRSSNLSPRPLVAEGIPISCEEVKRELELRHLPEDVLGISLALGHLGAKHAGQSNARILCKSPDNLEVVEQFRDGFEDTTYVHLIRDPRAVWNSARGTPRGPQTPHASALKWADYHARVLSLAQEIPLITLKYEELMLHPETELERACNFLDIPFSHEMLEDYDSVESKSAASTNPELWGNLANPVMQSRIDAWKRELPENEIEIIENSCSSVMAAYSYEPIFPSKTLTDVEKNFQPEFDAKSNVAEPRKQQLLHLEQLKSALLANEGNLNATP